MRRILYVIVMTLLVCGVRGQELQCTVNINSEQVQGSNQSLYTTLQQSIEEYVNTLRWTNMTFQSKERIECSMLIVVKSVQDNVFTCEFTCQSRRPV